jgi:hypothetical protein
MNNLEMKILIGNKAGNLYLTIERLVRNGFPRGLFNEYDSTILEISELKDMELQPSFNKIYEDEITAQAKALAGTELKDVSSKIEKYKTPSLLKQWVDTLFINNLSSFLEDELIYLKELLIGRSRKRTKIDYLNTLAKRITFAEELLQVSKKSDESLNKKVGGMKFFVETELTKLA